MSHKKSLSHPVALLKGENGTERIEVGQLQAACGKDPTTGEAQRIAQAGRDRKLRSPRCGSLLHTVFTSSDKKRWYFARYASEKPCYHDDPDEQDQSHATAVEQLYKALRAANPDWRVKPDHRLKVGRYADVIAVSRYTRTGVVFEVQRHPPSKTKWKDRHEDIESTGIEKVYWFMCDRGQHPSQDDSGFFELWNEEAAQRQLYLGSFKGEDALQAYEQVVFYNCPDPIQKVQDESFMALPDDKLPHNAYNIRRPWIGYPLSKIRIVENVLQDSERGHSKGKISLDTGRDEHLQNHRKRRATRVRRIEEAHRAKEAENASAACEVNDRSEFDKHSMSSGTGRVHLPEMHREGPASRSQHPPSLPDAGRHTPQSPAEGRSRAGLLRRLGQRLRNILGPG